MKGQTGLKSSKKVIGITGNSGGGKTTVCKIIDGMGYKSIDCDEISHRVMLSGQSAFVKIVEAFGKEILGTDGQIDRKKLGAIVFGDEGKRTLLESIVHPIVIEQVLDELAAADSDCVIVEAVLLVESGLHKYCDAVWLVTASEEERLKRIIARDNLSVEAAQARMRNQRDTAHIAEIAQAIIVNDGDLELLQWQVKSALQRLMNSEK